MSWKEGSVQGQRVRFIGLHRAGEYSVTDLCKAFGVSRTAGDRLIKDYDERGLSALEGASRAPHNHPNATPHEIEERIKSCKGNHIKWGPKRIRHVLAREGPDTEWPAASTVGEILKRAGLTKKRTRRTKTGVSQSSKPLDASDSNAAWCADFKGEFILGNGQLCYPLTITDASARMLLRCQCLAHPSLDGSSPIFADAFRGYGLPLAIRTDNGVPFASTGPGGLTTLAVWWIRLGIRLDRTDKGHPE